MAVRPAAPIAYISPIQTALAVGCNRTARPARPIISTTETATKANNRPAGRSGWILSNGEQSCSAPISRAAQLCLHVVGRRCNWIGYYSIGPGRAEPSPPAGAPVHKQARGGAHCARWRAAWVQLSSPSVATAAAAAAASTHLVGRQRSVGVRGVRGREHMCAGRAVAIAPSDQKQHCRAHHRCSFSRYVLGRGGGSWQLPKRAGQLCGNSRAREHNGRSLYRAAISSFICAAETR